MSTPVLAPTEAAPETPAAPSVMDLERDYVLQNYARYPLIIQRGKGPYVFDQNGKRYLDFISGIGVNSLGHAHPRVVKTIREQAARIIHTSNLYYNEFQGPLAKRLCEISGLNRAFFCNSGAEAMEGALKMIRAHGNRTGPEKQEILTLDNSFHGRTLGAISVTGQPKYRKDFEPLLPGIMFIPAGGVEALEQAVSEKTAGIVIEWIQGEGGVYPVGEDFVRKARELADRYDALLVLDEIQCGVGRTGKYFGYQLAEPAVMPDVTVIAKPLAAGLALGAVIANEKAASAIGSGMHGTTFGGSALACRVALEFLTILDELLPSINRVGAHFRSRLEDLQRKYAVVKEVRGYGLMVGMELHVPGKQLVIDAMNQGLLMNCTHDTVLRFLPPYIVTEKEVDKAVKVVDKLLRGVKYPVEQGV